MMEKRHYIEFMARPRVGSPAYLSSGRVAIISWPEHIHFWTVIPVQQYVYIRHPLQSLFMF